MRLLSALFFICRKTAVAESAGLLWRAACPQDSSRGIGGMPTNKRSPFCTKGHCLPSQEGVPYFGHLFKNEKIMNTSDTIRVIIIRKLAMKI